MWEKKSKGGAVWGKGRPEVRNQKGGGKEKYDLYVWNFSEKARSGNQVVRPSKLKTTTGGRIEIQVEKSKN